MTNHFIGPSLSQINAILLSKKIDCVWAESKELSHNFSEPKML